MNVARQDVAPARRSGTPHAPPARPVTRDRDLRAGHRRRHRRSRLSRARARRRARRARARPRHDPLRRRAARARGDRGARPPATRSTCCPAAGFERSASAERDRAQPPHGVRHRGRVRPRASRLVRRLRPAGRRRRRRLRVAARAGRGPRSGASRRSSTSRRRTRAWPTASRCGSARGPRCRCPGTPLRGAVVTGNPIRPAIAAVERAPGDAAARRRRRREPGRPALNDAALELYDRWRDRDRRRDPPRRRAPATTKSAEHRLARAARAGRPARRTGSSPTRTTWTLYAERHGRGVPSGRHDRRARRGRHAVGAGAAARRARRPPDRATPTRWSRPGAAVMVPDARARRRAPRARARRAARRPDRARARWAPPPARSAGPTPPPASPTWSRRRGGRVAAEHELDLSRAAHACTSSASAAPA